MTATTWADPLTGSVTGGSPIVRWFGLLVRRLRGMLSASDAPEVERLILHARAIGLPVLCASSRDDLLERLDAAWQGAEYMAFTREAMPAMKPETLAALAIPTDALDAMSPVLGKGPTAIIAASAPLMAIYGGVLAHLATQVQLEPSDLPPDLYELLAEPGIHSTVKRSLLGGLRASAALIAVTHAVTEGKRIEPWLALALAEIYMDELYLATRLYASIPTDIEVPESVVPMHDRLDLDRLAAEVEANEFLWANLGALADKGLSCCDVPDDD